MSQDLFSIEDAAKCLFTFLKSLGPTTSTQRASVVGFPPPELIDDELGFLRLFVIMFCLKFTHRPMWRAHGQDVWDMFTRMILRGLERHDPKMALQVFEHRMASYGSCINDTALTHNSAVTEAALGLAFSVNCGLAGNPILCGVGAADFTCTFDAVEAFFAEHNLCVQRT